VVVEKDAGVDAHFTNRDYETSGAQIVYSDDEAYRRADILCRVSVISPHELDHIKPGSVICGFLHLAVAHRDLVARLMDLRATLFGYEIIRDGHGKLPVLVPMSEMAGQMALHIAAHYLQNTPGGRGVLMGNVTGVPPPTVLILGAGVVGRAAARAALAIGAHVVIIDTDYGKLRTLNWESSGQLVTVLAGIERLEKYTAIADVVIGAVLVPGGRAPFLVTEAMVKAMKPGSVIVDISIDQGGCVETSRPTTLDNPTFVLHDVVHYCVPNVTANVARTASRALANASLPYISALADKGVDGALRDDPGLAAGVYLYKGQMVHRMAGETLGIPVTPLEQLL
jgi:alanine dehydrogenase